MFLFQNIFLSLASGDLFAHHSIAIGLHVAVLILIKGIVDSKGSKLLSDKVNFNFELGKSFSFVYSIFYSSR